MLVQMTEVEARQEEYGETIAFIGLVNALLNSIDTGGGGVRGFGGVEEGGWGREQERDR
jgi:hypothetical protein